MGTEHFCRLEQAQAPVDARRRPGAPAGEHLELCAWDIAPGAPEALALARYAECFVVPLAGTLTLTDGAEASAGAGVAADGRRSRALERGSLAYWSAERGPAAVGGAVCRYLVVGWPHIAATDQSAQPIAPAPDAPAAPAEPPAVPDSPGADAPVPQRHGVWEVYRFDEALVPAAPGWRFFSVDGAYLTVGASYREALPPAREQPHSHDGEQINVALEGRFAFTVGGHTETLTAGWAALTPRGVTHTGLHLALPYFQLIFATPPRGRGYAEFLRSIYRPRA
jgi:mannose-6-phosphate isomerase-like protein (cupin superfamily)